MTANTFICFSCCVVESPRRVQEFVEIMLFKNPGVLLPLGMRRSQGFETAGVSTMRNYAVESKDVTISVKNPAASSFKYPVIQ